jgi:hypothetical protein
MVYRNFWTGDAGATPTGQHAHRVDAGDSDEEGDR